MRELTLPEISSVAGGASRQDTVHVTGQRRRRRQHEFQDPTFGGGFGGGPTIPTPPIPQIDIPEIEAPEHCNGGALDGMEADPPVPDGVDLGELRDIALAQGQELAALRAGDGAEHAIFLLQSTVNGALFPVSVTSGNSDSIEFEDIDKALGPFLGTSGINNFEIVAWNHVQTSPLPSGFSQSLSSNGSDWEFAQSIIDGGIASPNLVTYITTPDGTVYEYGIDEKDTNQIGCEVQ